MTISVIIPCRNEKNHICDFLNSLESQIMEDDWELEVLVADGRSDDGSRELLRSYAERNPRLRIVDNPERIVSTGLNAAIRASCGDIIIRMDAHTVYANDYIRACVHALEATGADNVGGPWVAKGKGVLGRAIAAAFQAPFCAGGGKAHRTDFNGEVDTVYLGCWRRDAFERFGMFDPELVRNQDDELNLRIRRKGGRVVQSTAIRSFYTPRSSIGTLFRQYSQYGFWRVAVMRKHGRLGSWRQAGPPLFVVSLMLGVGLILLAALFHRTNTFTMASWALTGEVALYIFACLAATVALAGEIEGRALVVVPLVIAIHHVAYGLGFLAGVFNPPRTGSGLPGTRRSFSSLTR